MRASRRWRDWNPPDSSEKGPEDEPPKPPKTILSVSSVPTQAVSEKDVVSLGIPPDDPAEWREPFAQWLDSACARHPRVFGGVATLHFAYCAWEIAQGGVPCTRKVFMGLLTEQDFLIAEVKGTVLVSTLALREDVEAAGV